MNTNDDRRIRDHALIGTEQTYHADLPPYDPATDPNSGTLVLGNGMRVSVLDALCDWNAVPGLDMLYVHCEQTGYNSHVTPADVGWSHPLRASEHERHKPSTTTGGKRWRRHRATTPVPVNS